jgi:hypothetical protein
MCHGTWKLKPSRIIVRSQINDSPLSERRPLFHDLYILSLPHAEEHSYYCWNGSKSSEESPWLPAVALHVRKASYLSQSSHCHLMVWRIKKRLVCSFILYYCCKISVWAKCSNLVWAKWNIKLVNGSETLDGQRLGLLAFTFEPVFSFCDVAKVMICTYMKDIATIG